MAAWVLPAVMAAVTIGATALSYTQQQEAAKQQRKANQVQRQGQLSEIRQARIQEVARARRARAAAVAAAESAGALGTGSSVAGGIGSVQSQSAGNQRNLTSQRDFAMTAGRRMDDASRASTRAGAFDLLGQTSQFGLNLYTNRAEIFGG